MPSSKSKKKASSKKSASAAASAAAAPQDAASQIANPLRRGLPALDSIMDVIQLPSAPPAPTALGAAAAPPAASKYRIIRTNEVDEYESEKMPSSMAALNTFLMSAAAAAPAGDNFKGTARKAAKLSIVSGTTKNFADLKDLMATLPSHEVMKALKIKTTATSDRVAQEKRNVRVRAFIYAASREDDNDFHLIIGRDPETAPELYMTMELSGLPPSSSAAFKKLKAARDAYKGFFANHPSGLPGLSYDFYDPPVPVEIEGSLFWDASHSSGSRPGPKSLKSRMPVVWEVHPISKIVYEP
jgi:hypothetical protein